MKFSHVVFDIDGTLLDTEQMVLLSLSETLEKECGRSIPPEKLTFALGIPGEDALRRLHVEPVERVCELWTAASRKYGGTVRVFPGVREILERLRETGIQPGVVTSRTKKEYREGFVPFGLAEFFQIAVCADDTRRHKPFADPMEAYLRMNGADRCEVLYVGDSEYDMACAKAAGVPSALALWGCRFPDGIVSDYRLQTPGEIWTLLEVPAKEA